MNTDIKKFWNLVIQKDGVFEITIDELELIEFLHDSGFVKYYIGDSKRSIYVKNEHGILTEYSYEQIKDFILDYVRDLPLHIIEQKYKREIERQLLKRGYYLLTDKLFIHLKVMDREVLKDTSEYALIPFKNGLLKIEKNNTILLNYNESKYSVWKDQIINHDFESTEEQSDFASFIKNVTGNDPIRFDALKSSIGYLVHNFKNPSITKSVVLCDAKYDFLGKPEGRTGKSLIGKAISEVRKTIEFNGKTFNPKERFAYQQVTLSAQLLFINDVNPDFKFENLFTVITDGIHIEKKNKDSFFIPYQDSPKVLITTNYSILGRGASFYDRMVEIALAPHYSDTYKPINEFGKTFFGKEWNDTDWNKFFSFIVKAVQFYLNNGLIVYDDENLKMKKQYQEFGKEFLEYFDDTIMTGKEFDKKTLYLGFTDLYSGKINVSQKVFTEKLMSYADSKNWKIITRKSNNNSFIKFEDE
jgi:hypothetical protein